MENTTMTTESKRAQYMRGDLTFSEYYGFLVEYIGEGALRFALPTRRDGTPRTPSEWAALIEEDKHLNNVPLRQWDNLHEWVRANLRGGAELAAINGTGGWSLSDSVCVLKETARRYAASEETR
jgi:hypothetical protein